MVGTRKIYDFAKKYIPEDLIAFADPNENEEQYYAWHVKRRVASIGMVWPLSGSNAWLGIKGLKKIWLLCSTNSLSG